MAGKIKGVQKRIQDEYPAADYFYCVSHKLNLALSDAAATIQMDRTMERIRKITVFFDPNRSHKRYGILQQKINEFVPESNRKKIAMLNPTRWVDRHVTLIAFKELLPAVLKALEEIDDIDKSSDASDFLAGLSGFSSIFSVVLAEHMAGHLKILASILQAKDLDLIRAYEEVDTLKQVIVEILSSKADFEKLFKETKKLCDQTGIQAPTIGRENRKGLSIEEFCEKTLFRPYLEALIKGVNDRFGKRQQTAFTLQYLIPSRCKELTKEKIEEAVSQYETFLPSPDDLESEIRRWKVKWGKGTLPSSVSDTLADQITQLSYPNIQALLVILASLPVSTATAERSFSTLGRIFSDHRASMTPQRVSQLALCSHYKKELDELDLNEVVDLFARKSTRRMDFV
jgi:hypothetical protein